MWAGALQLAGVERDNLRLAQLVASGASSLYGPADVAELSGTVCLPSERPGGPPVQLRFQFPKAYPLGAALKAQACTEAPRWGGRHTQKLGTGRCFAVRPAWRTLAGQAVDSSAWPAAASAARLQFWVAWCTRIHI